MEGFVAGKRLHSFGGINQSCPRASGKLALSAAAVLALDKEERV